MITISPIIMMITDGVFKGIVGQLAAIDVCNCQSMKYHIRVDYDNEITVLEHQVAILEMEGENYMSTYFLGNIKDIQFVTRLPEFDKNEINKVIFNDPATIVLWKDGTKTIVKCQKDKGDTYNPELGLAMCIIKKMSGNKGNYNDVFNKWLPKEE